MKQIEYLLQGLLLHMILGLFKLMPIGVSSAVGGWIGKNIIIHSNWTKIAKNNLRKVYPKISEKEIKKTIKGMWNNIGRVAGEAVHLESIVSNCGLNDSSKIVNVKGAEKVKALMEGNKSILFIGAHMGNWELVRVFETIFPDERLGCVYRKPNNPYVRNLLNKTRKDNKYILYPNNSDGMKTMTKDIKSGVHVGLLVDQWLSGGIKTKFLGIETKAPGLYAKFAKKYDTPIVPIKFIRLGGKCKFELEFDEQINVSTEDSDEKIVQKVNDKLTEYVNESPESWLWIHNRFKSEAWEHHFK